MSYLENNQNLHTFMQFDKPNKLSIPYQNLFTEEVAPLLM